MSKVILDTELLGILHGIVVNDQCIEDNGVYMEFLGKLGNLVTEYCGGDVVTVSAPMGSGDPTDRHAVHFAWNDSVPEEGGVFANFDTDKSLDEWIVESTVGFEAIGGVS
ncbi:MAG: hypothetical protein ACYC9J_11645 [Sulfuricaulis sp.]